MRNVLMDGLSPFRKDAISPTTAKDPFADIEAFVKNVNAGSTISLQARNNLPELKKHSSQIKQWYTESLEKCCEIFDGLPRSTLETVFGSNIDMFLKVTVFPIQV